MHTPVHPRATNVHTDGTIVLTFDDGPHPVWTPLVLEALRLAEATATFFVVTPLARRFPAVISGVREAGHTIELHCDQHVRHTQMTREEVEANVRSGLRAWESWG